MQEKKLSEDNVKDLSADLQVRILFQIFLPVAVLRFPMMCRHTLESLFVRLSQWGLTFLCKFCRKSQMGT